MRLTLPALSSEPRPAVAWTRGQGALVAGFALALGGWWLAFKLLAYRGLATTSDMYCVAQLATTWLEGRPYWDNFFGNQLAVHTFLSAPLLAVFVVPFGPPGLFGALALAAALGFVGLVRLGQVLGAPFAGAVGLALTASVMPLTVHTYQDAIYGFHLELLVPAAAVWQAYFLFRRHLGAAVLATVAVLSIKEDAVLIALPVALLVLVEDYQRGPAESGRWNRPALACAVLAVGAVPLLLALIAAQPDAGAVSNLARLRGTDGSVIASYPALALHLLGHVGTWLRSDAVGQWLILLVPATLGLVIVRPHLALLGLATTATSWLVREDLTWAPRFAPTLAFFQILACVAMAAATRLVAARSRRVQLGVNALAGVAMIGALVAQFRQMPATAQVYALAPTVVPVALRAEADVFFARYTQERRPGEAVVTSDRLFRYAAYADLLWLRRLADRPEPVWLLWDKSDRPLGDLWTSLAGEPKLQPSDYELLARTDTLFLFRRRTAPLQRAEPPRLAAAPHGAVNLRLVIEPAFRDLAEPLLEWGDGRVGVTFFLRHIDDEHVAIGCDYGAPTPLLSAPVKYQFGRVHDVTLFAGAFLDPGQLDSERAWHARNLIAAAWDGATVMEEIVRLPEVTSRQVAVGRNTRAAPRITPAFVGQIAAAELQDVPAPPAGAFGRTGPLRFLLHMPGTASGLAEPLLVCGEPGRAMLAYVRLLPGGLARVGCELWGVGAFESDPFALANPGRCTIEIEAPELDSPSYQLRVDGVVRWQSPGPAGRAPAVAPLHFGENPVGGSWVSARFTGEILQVSRLPQRAGR